jgi:hypothetical protein
MDIVTNSFAQLFKMMGSLSLMLDEASLNADYDFDMDPIPVESTELLEYTTLFFNENNPKMTWLCDPSHLMAAHLLDIQCLVPVPTERRWCSIDQHSEPNHALRNNRSLEKPKKPLSAYNLFFQHEREKIITSSPLMTFEESMQRIHHSNTRPIKRKHRKSHGKISFGLLARTIADKWKSLDAAGKVTFLEASEDQKASYNSALEEWTRNEERKATHHVNEARRELARVEQDVFAPKPLRTMMEDDITKIPTMERQTSANFLNNVAAHDSPSSLVLHSNNVSSQYQTQREECANFEDFHYMQMTQQTIEMARASLKLPLFAGLGGQQTRANIFEFPHTAARIEPVHLRTLMSNNSMHDYAACFHSDDPTRDQNIDFKNLAQNHDSYHVVTLPNFYKL